jgi:hypothetical protein
VLAKKVKEVDFFKGALQKAEARRQGKLWRNGIYDEIRELMHLQGNLSIETMCGLAQVSRAGLFPGELLSSLARLRFASQDHPGRNVPVFRSKISER